MTTEENSTSVLIDYLNNKAKKTKCTNCKLILSRRSQFFHKRRFFSSNAKLRPTIQCLEITADLCNSLCLATCTVMCSANASHTLCAKGFPARPLSHKTLCTLAKPVMQRAGACKVPLRSVGSVLVTVTA